MTDINFARVAIVLLFAITFIVLGTSAPVLYATYAPQGSIIEVHNFEAQDTTTESSQHYICFDRTIYQPATGEAMVELYLVDSDDRQVEIGSQAERRYFQQGKTEIIEPLELPENLKQGEYRYILVVSMDLSDGRVTRDFTYTSKTFEVMDGTSVDKDRPMGC